MKLTPQLRVALRAFAVGVGVALESLQASGSWDGAVVRGAIIAGSLAALEVFTPLNALVGPGKAST